MRVSPIGIYTALPITLKRKTDVQFRGEEAKRTSEPNLNTYVPLMNNKMKLNANIKFFLGGINNVDTNTKRRGEAIKIADIGC